jgi:LmbE family N-acetylglucosaminyl deacetylase
MRRVLLLATLMAVAALTGAPAAQHRLQPIATERGELALRLLLRKLDTVGTLMMTTAHPDDENNAMLAFYGHGRGFRTALVTATRGEGGQNEIGPELFEALAVLRTEELLAAHVFDGAEQYFTRAVDFGYSFSVEENIEKWGRQEIVGDFVRMIRTIRPDVIVGFLHEGAGGGQAHQASTLLAAEAFRAAADPTAFPEQIEKEGLRPWQAKKFYATAGFGGARGAGAADILRFTSSEAYDPLLGRTYAEIGAEARSMHKCQGMSQLLPLPAIPDEGFGGLRGYRLLDSVLPAETTRGETDPFDGIDTRLASLARYAGATPPDALVSRLEEIQRAVDDARAAAEGGGSGAAVTALVRGLSTLRQLRRALAGLALSDEGRYEIDHRLAIKERQFSEALLLAADVRIDAIARDGLVVPGQSVEIDLLIANRSRVPVMIARRSVSGFAIDGPICKDDLLLRAPEGRAACSVTARIPDDARLTAAHFRYADDAARFVLDPDVPPGLPFRPTPFTATFDLNVAGADVSVTQPIEWRSEGDIFSGEKRADIHVVPKFAVRVSPEIAIVPARSTAASAVPAVREVRVTVTNHSPGKASGTVHLEVPEGWTATPSSAPVEFTREDESMTVRFQLTPPPAPARTPGDHVVRAYVTDGQARYAMGYQVVEYPHTHRRHVLRAPEVMLKTIDVTVDPGVDVGYVMGVGDAIPPALRQLGARVELLSEDDLAWGDLSRFDVIMTGVRAYERRADLRAYNHRLIEYARRGGTVIVNYNKFEFNEAQYGPYPGQVGRDRVTDENSPVRVLVPEHPVFNAPNKITEADWQGWRQERGLYFFDTAQADPRYVDLIELEDPFPYNKGPKRGALVEARVGEGRWIYVGLGLWRQLPAGTDGAYRLMANLISLD